jgi:hypothetical protein
MSEFIRERRPAARPFFSICIPQYNRTSFLLHALERLKEQTSRNFEVCISDDSSTDGRADELVRFLDASGMAYAYTRQPYNLRYDGNLRASIALAQGQYAWLMGNDDCLAEASTLKQIQRQILETSKAPAVILTNYREFDSGRVMRRVRNSGWMDGTIDTAARVFRNFSFVSGVILDAKGAQQEATAKWDGSEMYQMYMACRLIARGGGLLNCDAIAVCQGIRLPNEQVDSYARKPRLDPCPIIERELTLTRLGRVVWDAVEPYTAQQARGRIVRTIFLQILVLTYPFWLFEYRRVQSWNYAAGVALGMRPRNILRDVKANLGTRGLLSIVYTLVSAVGLVAPLRLFDTLYPKLYGLAKTLTR